MFFFSIKKAFFDAWDHLVPVILVNFSILTVIMLGLWPMLRMFESRRSEGFFVLLVFVPLIFILSGITSALTSQIADFEGVRWNDVPKKIREAWKPALFFGILVPGFFSLSFFGMSYYVSLNNTIGIMGAALLFWIALGVYLATLWFFPVKNRLSGGFWKCIKKSILIALDNLLLSLFVGIILVPLQLFLWPITAFGAFGPGGIALYQNVALRLLMYKYDWLEENPETKKRDIPWYELLVDEKERVGKRTLKGMIFPWRE